MDEKVGERGDELEMFVMIGFRIQELCDKLGILALMVSLSGQFISIWGYSKEQSECIQV